MNRTVTFLLTGLVIASSLSLTAFHIAMTFVAMNDGFFAALMTFFFPVLSEIYWVIKLWHVDWINSWVMWNIPAVIVLLILNRLGGRY